MFNLVPLAGARWIVAHGDGQARSVRELLQLPFPQTRPGAIAASRIRGNQETGRAAVHRATHSLPPAANGVHGKAGRVMINPHADPAFVATQVIDPPSPLDWAKESGYFVDCLSC